MRVGLIARDEARGLGQMSCEIARHLDLASVLVVHPNHDLPSVHHFSNATHVGWSKHGGHNFDDPAAVRRWMLGLDVILSLETFYDWAIVRWARDRGIRTVLWAMPEYLRLTRKDNVLAFPDAIWNSSSWRQNTMPEGTQIVPVPVPIDRWPLDTLDLDVQSPPRWLHVAGARAAADRNGTRVVLEALRYLRREHHVTIRAHDESVFTPQVGPKVRLEVHCTGLANYWDLYSGQDALILPRRYGGLSLPAIESMGAGLALVMPDVSPQRDDWPILPVAAPFLNHIVTGAGEIPICAPDPVDLARLMDVCADHPEILVEQRRKSRAWAERHSWEKLGPSIMAELEKVGQ